MSSTRSRLLSLGQTKPRRIVRLVLEQLEDRCLLAPVAGTWLVQFDSLAGDTQDSQIAEANSVVITDARGKDLTFTVDDKTKVSAAGAAAKITDLKAADEVTVTYTKVGEKMTASAIDRK